MTPPPAPQAVLDDALLQQAAQWMAQLWSDDASDQDRADCARWRAAHPGHEQAWQRLLAFENKLLNLPREAASHALRQPAGNTGRRRALRTLGLGAILMGTGYVAHNTGVWQRVTADYRSATGEIRDLILPDGSRVTLSTATDIDLRFSATERLVVLRAGEILAVTAPDTAAMARPFLVRTRHGLVQALGTRYSVRDEGDTSRVAVFAGAVEIRPADAPGFAVRLNAGQGSRFARDRVERPVAVAQNAAAWSRGVLVADGMRLADVAAELGRYRPGILHCDPAVADLRVSGVFPLRDTGRALDNLTRGLPITVVYRTRYWVTLRAAG